MSAASAALDAELQRAAVDEQFGLSLRAWSRGGRAALDDFCTLVEQRSGGVDEAPALALVAALADPEAAERAVRAVAWAMVAQRVASSWPYTFYEVLEVARAAMPLSAPAFERMQTLGALTACANTTQEPDTRDGQRLQFSRESLEHVIGEATRVRPVRRDMLHVLVPWTGCFIRGIEICEVQRAELERIDDARAPAPGSS
jgi:hypothetical protein